MRSAQAHLNIISIAVSEMCGAATCSKFVVQRNAWQALLWHLRPLKVGRHCEACLKGFCISHGAVL